MYNPVFIIARLTQCITPEVSLDHCRINAGVHFLPFLLQSVRQPLQAFEQTLTLDCRSLEYGPLSILDAVQIETLCNSSIIQSSRQVLFVGIYEDHCILELFLVENSMKLLLGSSDTLSIARVDDINNRLCVREVASPVWSNTCLTTEIPDLELDVLVVDCFHIETNGWDCRHDLSDL